MVARKRDLTDTRQRILAAAERVSFEAGPARISLEAVAAEAGISKGGLLYHFRSKQELLRALVEDHVEHLRRRMDALAPGAREAGDGMQALRAYVIATREMLAEIHPAASGVFAAIAEEPTFIAPIRTFCEEMRQLISTTPDPARAMIVFLACEGLIHEKLTDVGCSTPADLVFDALLEMIGNA